MKEFQKDKTGKTVAHGKERKKYRGVERWEILILVEECSINNEVVVRQSIVQ